MSNAITPEMLRQAEDRYRLPRGLLASIKQQETGGKDIGLEEYHYPVVNGKRVAKHTGKVSTAFGPFGLLESTASKPGYGVEPLKNKGATEQVRFAAEYLANRIKHAGSLVGGLAGYGEGEKYANQVLGRAGLVGNSPVMMPVVQAASSAPMEDVAMPKRFSDTVLEALAQFGNAVNSGPVQEATQAASTGLWDWLK